MKMEIYFHGKKLDLEEYATRVGTDFQRSEDGTKILVNAHGVAVLRRMAKMSVMDEIENKLAVKLYELESRIKTLEFENRRRPEGKKVPLEVTVDKLVARVAELEAENERLEELR